MTSKGEWVVGDILDTNGLNNEVTRANINKDYN